MRRRVLEPAITSDRQRAGSQSFPLSERLAGAARPGYDGGVTLAVVVRGLGGGALIGLAAAIALAVHGRIAGISGILGRALDGGAGRTFRFGFLAGLVATGVVVAAIAPSAFGGGVRGLPALAVAGALVGIGTTLSNGCTSGHGVCGLARLSPRSFAAVAAFMVTAAITVALVGPHA